jgi:nucleoid-associated protein EbfC
MSKGFNRPRGGSPGGMMQQIKQMQEQMAAAQAQLAEETVTSSVGGGTVKITMTGDQVCKSVVIDAELLTDPDVEMLQDLILSAINTSLEQSRALAAERMGPLASGLPGLGL